MEARMKSRGIFLVILLAIILFFTGCNDSGNIVTANNMRIIYITNEMGVDDLPENGAVEEGILQSESELGFENEIIETYSSEEFVSSFNEAVSTKDDYYKDQYIILNGDFHDESASAVENAEQQQVAVIEGNLSSPYILNIDFIHKDGAFMAGLIAGLETENDQIAYIGGLERLNQDYLYAFKAGVATVNPNAEVTEVYTDTYNSVKKGAEVVNTLLSENGKIDIIYNVSGGCTPGVMDESANYDVKIVNSDINVYGYTNDQVIATLSKDYTVATEYAINCFLEGLVTNRQYIGNEENAYIVEYSDEVSEQIQAKVEEEINIVLVEGIDIPETSSELKNYISTLQ
jgi:basic membrane protein A